MRLRPLLIFLPKGVGVTHNIASGLKRFGCFAVDEKADGKRGKAVMYGIFALSLALSLLFIFTHEMWRDETQAWLISKNLSFYDIWYNERYEGHPVLWHFLLAVFSKCGLPMRIMFVLSFAFTSMGTWLLMFRTRLCNVFKAAIALNPFVFYYFAAFARPYALEYFLLCAVAALYPARRKRAVLFGVLMFCILNVHVQAAGVACAFMLLEFIDMVSDLVHKKKLSAKRIIGMLIAVCGLVLLVATLITTFSANGEVKLDTDLRDKLYLAFTARIPTVANSLHLSHLMPLRIIFGVILGMLLITLFIFLLEYPRAMTVFFGGTIYLIVLAAMVYPSSKQKSACLFLFFALTAVVAGFEQKKPISELFGRKKKSASPTADKKPEKQISVNITKLICIPLSFFLLYANFGDISFLRYDITSVYSDAENTAEALRNSIPEGETVYCAATPNCSCVGAFAENYTYIDIPTGGEFTYCKWTNERRAAYEAFDLDMDKPLSESDPLGLLRSYILKCSPESESVYVLIDDNYLEKLIDPIRDNAEEIYYETPITEVDKKLRKWGESYVLFRLELSEN